MSRIAESIAQRVQKLAGPTTPEEPAAEPASASEPSDAAPPAGSGSEVESVTAAPDTPTAVDDTATRHALLQEKLAAARAANRERRLKNETLTAKEQAEADRRAAADERAKYEALRTGSFKQTLEALGRDPGEAFREMQQEAIEAGKPEAEIRRMRQDFERQMGEKLKPLEETIAELKRQNEDLLNERRHIASQEERRTFIADYEQHVKTDAYLDLRIEYGDKRLFNLVEGMKKNPPQLRAYAKELGVKLTFTDNRFNMQDILNVLDAAHKAHDTERKQRREQMQAPTTSTGSPQAPANAKTVNGTADRRNAETNPLGNETAATNASAPAQRPRLSKQGRVERAMQRDAARRG